MDTTTKSFLLELSEGYSGCTVALDFLSELPAVAGQIAANPTKVAALVKSLLKTKKLLEPIGLVHTSPDEYLILSGRHRIAALAVMATSFGLNFEDVMVPVYIQSYGAGWVEHTNNSRRFSPLEKAVIQNQAGRTTKATATKLSSYEFLSDQEWASSFSANTIYKMCSYAKKQGMTPALFSEGMKILMEDIDIPQDLQRWADTLPSNKARYWLRYANLAKLICGYLTPNLDGGALDNE